MHEEEQPDQQLLGLPEGWSSDINECMHISLVRADGHEHDSFEPTFTDAIFGDSKAVFGYKGLSVDLTFAAHNLESRVDIGYDAIYEAQGDIKPTDLKAALEAFLPAEAFRETPLSGEDAGAFVPPGERVRTYKHDGIQYEVRCASLADTEARQLLERMQILTPLCIENGTMLELELEWTTKRWKLFTLWTVSTTKNGTTLYSLVGYGTSYRVFTAPKAEAVTPGDESEFLPGKESSSGVSSPLDLLSRERLSQFLILPGHQNGGHGAELYRTMYEHLTTPPNVIEFTIEDPNEAFDKLRDFCDITFLRARHPEFAALEINTDIPSDVLGSSKTIPTDLIVSKELRDKIRTSTKIETRQFNRLVEIHTLSKIPPSHQKRARTTRREKATNDSDKQYYFWRLYVKQRLLIFNEDALMQVDHPERIEKLEVAVDSIQQYAVGMIKKVLKREAAGISIDGDEHSATNGSSSLKRATRKRTILDDNDDENDEDSNDMVVRNKRSKVG